MNTVLLAAALLLGAEPEPAPMDNLNRLVQIRESMEAIGLLRLNGFDVDPDGKYMEAMLKQANQFSNGKVKTYSDLVDLTGRKHKPPTSWEKAKGVITFVNILWFTGGLLSVIAAIWLFGHYFLSLIVAIPATAWEIILYGVCAALIGLGSQLPEGFELFPVLIGCLGLPGCIYLTDRLHFKHTGRYAEACLLIAIVWGLVAISYGSHVIGFLTVMALMSSLGFFCAHLPGIVMIGFWEDAVVARATLSAGVMLFLHVFFSVTGTAASQIEVFRDGMSFMGSFVYFLGLLFLSSKYYWRTVHYEWQEHVRHCVYRTNWGAYWAIQILVIVSGMAALFLGSVYDLGALLGIGGTFFYIWILEKYYELPWRGIGWAWSLLGLGVLLYGFAIFARANPQYFLFGW